MYLVLVGLLILFMFFDVWYFFHMGLIYVACYIRRRIYPRKPFVNHQYREELKIQAKVRSWTISGQYEVGHVVSGHVGALEALFMGIMLTTDMTDGENITQMNNPKYFREFEYGKTAFWLESRFYDVIKKHGGTVETVGTCFRVIKPLKIFARYYVYTKMIYWDEEAFYFKQEIVLREKTPTISAYNFSREILHGTSPDDVIKELCGDVQKPEKTNEIEQLISVLTSMRFADKKMN